MSLNVAEIDACEPGPPYLARIADDRRVSRIFQRQRFRHTVRAKLWLNGNGPTDGAVDSAQARDEDATTPSDPRHSA